MALPPILYHHFTLPLPYARTWLAQEQIHNIQLRRRRASSQQDILLLLQHRPTYTSGRRQTEPSIQHERSRLTAIGADFVAATRGGQLTYHGPGQVVGYPLLDLSRYTPTMGARDYVCRIQKSLQNYLYHSRGITHSPSEHTGVFLDHATKIASIGVQVRHRLTSHGFAINITSEPIPWFNQIVACGLDDVVAGSVESKTRTPVEIEDEIPALVHSFSQVFQRDMVRMDLGDGSEVGRILLELEKEARHAGSWFVAPNRIDSQ